MERQRVEDRLVGAAVAVLVLLLVTLLLLWWVSDPVGQEGVAGAPSTTGAGRGEEPDAPDDLADEEIWLSDLVLDAGSVVTPDERLTDVHAVGSDVRTGGSGLVAGSLTVEATVPFDVVARELGDGITVRAESPSEATVVRTVVVAGRRFRVAATGTVDVVAGAVVVEPRSIDFGGPAFVSGALGALVRRLVTIEHEIEGLPEGLVLDDVTVREDGLRATLTGDDVVVLP